MKNILKISILTFAAFATTGCIKETVPNSVVTSDQVSQSPTALEAMVNAIPVNEAYPYSVFGSSSNYGFDFGLPGIICALDACAGEEICTGGDEQSGYDWFTYWKNGTVLGPTQTVTRYAWYCYYNFIKSCNDVIGMLPDPEVLGDSEKAFLAYSKANRASLYLDMARQFEALENKYTDVSSVAGLTVPIITENTTEQEARNNPRATRDEIFKFIFDDLDSAEALLTDNSVQGNKTVPSLAVVYGLKARAYLWLGGFDSSNYAKAAEFARKAIDESGAKVMTEAQWLDPKTGFNTVNNSWLWYLPQSSENVTNLVNFVAWRSAEATWGYGSMVQQGVSSKFWARMSDTDWRKRAFIGPDPDAWYEENSDISLWPACLAVDKTYSFNPYASVKFRPAAGEVSTYKTGNATSIPMMRVEEMYLIEAEATAYTNPSAAAKLLKDFMATRDPEFALASETTKSVVDAVIWNKRIEFWGEGIVFYDFKRLNYGIETGYSGTNAPTDTRIVTDGRAPWWNFCIPEVETQQNEALKGKNNPNPVGIVKPWTE